MSTLRTFSFEGRDINYTFRPAEDEASPLLVLLHGHTKTPRPSKFSDPRWSILCPVDNFGVGGAGSWYLGEGGDLFWLRAMPALIAHVSPGRKLFFAGSSMGGYGAILHGSLNSAYGVYANVAQTLLLGSTYSDTGMIKYFGPIFDSEEPSEYNDLRNVISRRMPTTFMIAGYRFDKVNYLEEQTFPFLERLIKQEVNFSHELRLGHGHSLTHSTVEISDLFLHNMANILENYDRKSGKKPLISPASPNSTTSLSSRCEVGKILVQSGQWYVDKFGTAQLEAPINWKMDPFRNRSWVWLLHQLSFIQNLVAFDRHEKGIEGAVWAMQAIRSWWRLHANPETAPPYAWHDHGSAKRVENLVLLRNHLRAHLGKDERITHSDLRLLRTMLETHARFLADGSKYSKGTNHGLEQSLALFILSCESSHETWAKEFRTMALKRIRCEVSTAFSDDGGHNENSPQYQKYGVWQLLKLEKLFKRYQKHIPREETSLFEILNKSTFALSYMIAPNGVYPPIGDTEAISYKDVFPGHDYPETHPAYLFSISKGRDGVPPAAPDLILTKSGWAVLRSSWKGEKDLHLLTKCAFNSHYHRHDDDTSFVLNAHGEEWITDGGLYKYEEKDPMRIHLRSHYAHSLSAPDGVEPIRNVKLHGGRNKIEDFHSGKVSSWVDMTSHMFPRYVSRRRIALERATSKISVTDRLTPLDDTAASLSCTTRFLVPQNKSVSIEGSNVRIEGVGHSLLICPDREANRVVVTCGQTEPELRGWQSRKFNTIDPAHSIEFHYNGGELNVTYHLNFSEL